MLLEQLSMLNSSDIPHNLCVYKLEFTSSKVLSPSSSQLHYQSDNLHSINHLPK